MRDRVSRFPRITALHITASLLLASATYVRAEDIGLARPTPPSGAPNVLVIMTDDVGFAAGSTFGGEIPTPTMDRLAQSGLTYSNFHTTGVCSPSRAALLTGRNHHAVGFGSVSDLARNTTGYTSIIPASAATLAQVLKSSGYSTAAFGKNHNTPSWESGPLGPFNQWMSGLGFDYFYGFHGGHTNQFFPGLIENNSMVEPPVDPTFILDRDLADRAVQWLQTQRVQGGGRPFLLYYAPGTAHAPLHAPAEWLTRFRGKFDEGWDVLRQRVFERQKSLGVIPPNAKLAPMPPEVRPWANLSDEERRVSTRLMEAYAAALAYCDDQIGRVIEELRQSGQFENTLIVYIQGDNGATPEGGLDGMINYGGRFSGQGDPANTLAHLDEIGGPNSYPVAPIGWMMAMNTPFPYHKVVASRLGGIRNGMVISWPRRIAARGVRTQFTHLVDVMPTVLEVAGIEPPASVNGVAQQPFDGISFSYTFSAATTSERHRSQYFEVFGNAAFYQNGWLIASPAQSLGRGAAPALSETWELFDLRSDPSQTANVADRFPEKLRQMRAAFEAEAQRNHVYPLSADNLRYLFPNFRPAIAGAPGRYTFYPSHFRYPREVFPRINNRSWSIEADLEVSPSGSDGVLVTQGGRFSGWGLVLLEGKPNFLYRTSDTAGALTRLVSSVPLTPGRHLVEVRFTVDGTGLGKGGTLAMKIDGTEVATGRLIETVAIRFGEEDATIGHDTGTPLTDDYRVPFRATGLRSVTFELGEDQSGLRVD